MDAAPTTLELQPGRNRAVLCSAWLGQQRMTIRKKIETELVNHGLWPKEAEVVMTQLEADKISEPMKGRWDEDETAYPPQLFAVTFLSAKRKAVEWIDANSTEHFARGLLS